LFAGERGKLQSSAALSAGNRSLLCFSL